MFDLHHPTVLVIVPEAYKNTATREAHPRNTTFITRGMAGEKSTMGMEAMACEATLRHATAIMMRRITT